MGHLPGEAGAALGISLQGESWGSGRSLWGGNGLDGHGGHDLAAVESQGRGPDHRGELRAGLAPQDKAGCGGMDLVEATFWSEVSF